jgi:hypothetical protein
MKNLHPLNGAVGPTRDAGVQVELGGEQIGIVAALLVLVLAFGSVGITRGARPPPLTMSRVPHDAV